MINAWIDGAVIGIVATVTMDLWALVARRLLGWPTADWSHVGRWFAHMPSGRFVHRPIGAAPPVRGERAIGWAAHYAIGIVYGIAYLALMQFLSRDPAGLLPALAFSWALLAFPWLVMQPALGGGFFASRAPDPGLRRLVSVTMHTAFGLGLFAGAHLWNLAG